MVFLHKQEMTCFNFGQLEFRALRALEILAPAGGSLLQLSVLISPITTQTTHETTL